MAIVAAYPLSYGEGTGESDEASPSSIRQMTKYRQGGGVENVG